MYARFGWRVQGNKEAAENLAAFLINCDLESIKSLNPIKFLENVITLNYKKTYLLFKPSTSWSSEDNFYHHSLSDKERDRVEKGKKMFVVSVLKKLDKEGIVLPFFDKLHEVPGIISSRVRYINNNERYKDSKLSKVLKETDSPSPLKELFSEDFTEFNIPDYTAKAIILSKKFAQQGPGVIYSGEYFFDRGSISLQDISIKINKEIRLKKETVNKCPLKVIDIETIIENDSILTPRKMEFVDSAGYKFTVKKTEDLLPSSLLINKDYTTEYKSGAIYSPKHTEDLTTLETLAYWLIENNISQEETKLKEEAETVKVPENSGISENGEGAG